MAARADKGKGKQAAVGNGDAVCEVKQPPTSGEDGRLRTREVEKGITIWFTETQPSPFTISGNFFYAVHFDANSFVNNEVTFDGCVLINVSFKGCILSDVKFVNTYLQDMEFIARNFNEYTWINGSEFNQRHGD